MKIFALLAVLLSTAACSHSRRLTGAQHHYPLSGKIVSVDAQHQTALIDASAIPNYMEAMTMEYPIESRDDLRKLKAGDTVTATVNVADAGGYDLSDVKVLASGR